MQDIAMVRKASRETSTSMSAPEKALRRDLAAAYRLAALFGWVDILGTHFSVRLPGEPGAPESFLINPFGMLFEEITASSLIKVDVEGNILSETDYPVNKAGFVVHSALHMSRDDAGCVMHLHTDAGVAVSALEAGLLPLNQIAIGLQKRVAIHEYEGPAVSLEERKRLASDLGHRNFMLLRNHGTITVGRTVAEAFVNMYALEHACRWQVQTLSMGMPWHRPAQSVIDAMTKETEAGSSDSKHGNFAEKIIWPGLLRKLDRTCPDYCD
jgi:ribulose-5-phosphate 4-epimerase/fuculose-1-phosphate aldolase